MKAFYFILFLSLCFSSLGSEMAIQSNLDNFFASEMSKTYEKSFLENLESYNSSKHTVGSVLSQHNGLANIFKQKASLYKNDELPQLSLSGDSATTQIGPNTIRFSVASLIEGEVFLNDAKISLIDLDYDFMTSDLRIKTTKTNIWERGLDIIMNKAHANNSDKFEVLIFSTLIALKDDFDSSWCMFDSCREVRAKRNFEMTMQTIKLEAIKCENRDTNFSLPSELEDYPNTQMSITLKDKLVDLFQSFPRDHLSCQKMVEKFRNEEIKKITHRIERRGYGGVDSVTAEENREANKKDFDRYIQDVCAPYVELRNCMIDRHAETQTIHDKARGHGKRGTWESYHNQYDVLTRGQGVQR